LQNASPHNIVGTMGLLFSIIPLCITTKVTNICFPFIDYKDVSLLMELLLGTCEDIACEFINGPINMSFDHIDFSYFNVAFNIHGNFLWEC
jgi:hypothetical protein